jgi:hypothetical protein
MALRKRYELHYHPKKVEVGEAVLEAQFGCLNFYMKHYKGSGAEQSLQLSSRTSGLQDGRGLGFIARFLFTRVLKERRVCMLCALT